MRSEINMQNRVTFSFFGQNRTKPNSISYSIMYSPTPVIRTSVIRNLDYPNGVPNVESV